MCKRQLPNILKMNNFDLRKYLAENKLIKENINLEDALDKFESLEDEFSYNPSIDGIQEIGNFIDFLRERHPNGVGYEVDLDAEFTAFDESEYEPSYKTHVDINNYISFLGEYGNETFLEEKKEELEEIDMTISSEAVESSVKQGLNQMFERLADAVDDKDDIQSETLGVTNYIKRLMKEYAKYANMDRRDSIEGGNKFSKQGKEEARQEIERILSMEY